jgi:uncharacterized protein YggE
MNSRPFLSRLILFGILAVSLVGCSAILPASAQPSQLVTDTIPAGGTTQGVQTPQLAGQGITIVGTGQASGAPDMVQISIGVQTINQNVQQAVSDNATQMNALLAVLKSLGIADKDIQTSNYSVSLQQPSTVLPAPDGKGTTPSGSVTYAVNNQVAVTLHDVSKLGSVLDKVVASGANNIYGVSFGISDPSSLQETARSLAVKDATTRAQSLAKLAGVTLGAILSISENPINPVPGPFYASGLGGGGSTPIQPGQLQVTETLQVTYAIK